MFAARPADEVLKSALRASAAAGLPEMSVSPAQGKMLNLLARARGARRIRRSAPSVVRRHLAGPGPAADGHLVTLEADTRHAEVARENLALAGLADLTEIRLARRRRPCRT